ncbi:hypothetical protein D5W64_12800 [Salmonella enterica subsp. enterica serovar Saintpaul]|nr:hypothetical protein [Salmonella enterica subsp. enterica serovar Saintpaul]
MDLFSELVVERGDIKVTLNGYLPTKGHLREVFEVDIQGLPTFKVSLNDTDIPIIQDRNSFVNAVRKVLNEVWAEFDIPGDPKGREVHSKIQVFQRAIRDKQNKVLNNEVIAYANRLKQPYMLNPAFSWGRRTLGIRLSRQSPYNAILRFKPIRPQHYEVHFTFNCFSTRTTQLTKVSFSYDRTYPVENIEYLFKQILEWLKYTFENNKLDTQSYNELHDEVVRRFKVLEPLIKDALLNLNEGNNL